MSHKEDNRLILIASFIKQVHFHFKGCWWYFLFKYYSNFDIKLCMQAVKTLITRHVLLLLIWVCTICPYPVKKTLGLYGLHTIINDFGVFMHFGVLGTIVKAFTTMIFQSLNFSPVNVLVFDLV